MKKIFHNKIMIASVIFVLVVSLAACGGKTNSGATDETTESNPLESSATVSESKDSAVDASEDAKTDAEVDTTPVETQPETKPETKSETTQSAEKPASKPATQPAEKPASKPASHTHDWKEHHATKQVWVSKIVPQYETKKVQTGTHKVSDGWFWHCNCGAVIPINQYEDHAVAHIEADEPDNGYEKEHFHDEPTYEEQHVQVGTKDEGYYETQSYVDYYYCDCGAKK